MARLRHGGLLALLFVLGGAAAGAEGDAARSSSSCEALGFTGLGLCSDCDQLETFAKDPQLTSECRQCCVKDEDGGGGAKFTEAVLEVCSRRLAWYPDILSFIEDKAKGIAGLKVSYRIGAAPKLIMKDKASGEHETIRIDTWKSENVEQFLQAKLVVPAASK